MYLYLIFVFVALVDAFVANRTCFHALGTHRPRRDTIDLYSVDRRNFLNSKPEEDGKGGTESTGSGKDGPGAAESRDAQDDDSEMVEFLMSSAEGKELSKSKFKITKKLWKLLTALLVYRSKFGDYRIENDFAFKKTEQGHLAGYKLGRTLRGLLNLIHLKGKNTVAFKKYRQILRSKKGDFIDADLREAPRLLWLLGFPLRTYLEESRMHQKMSRRDNIISSKMSSLPIYRKLKRGEGEEARESHSPLLDERVTRLKQILVEDMLEHKKRKIDEMVFSNPQQLPEPSNKAEPRPDLVKQVVREILDNKATCPLIKRDTRDETEGGHHYAFYHWSFEQVLQALVMFNDMYFDFNKELLIACEKNGDEFKPITFNVLKESWQVPEDENWPADFHGMPLGVFVDKFRNGDIDAKEHWLRRPILDHIGFNWGDGLKYLNFTWDKLYNGLIWYINFRGFPVSDISPDLVIPKTSLVAKFGKPEEIQGLKLGRLFFSAMDQIQVIRKYYKSRFTFLRHMGFDIFSHYEMDLGYRPIPHSKYNKVDSNLRMSRDERYLFDEINEPPEDLEEHVVNIMEEVSDFEP